MDETTIPTPTPTDDVQTDVVIEEGTVAPAMPAEEAAPVAEVPAEPTEEMPTQQ